MATGSHSAVVIGSGPNGLAAGIELARAGVSVTVLEAASTYGGGLRTEELTLPGYRHDVCASVHAMAAPSPFFRTAALDRFGLTWVEPAVPLAHPFDDGTAAVLHRDLEATCGELGVDGSAWRALVGSTVRHWRELEPVFYGPFGIPTHPLIAARFGAAAVRSASGLARSRFRTAKGRALFAGLAAHSVQPLDRAGTAAVGLVLAAAAHVGGWPFARSGSRAVADAMVSCLESLGGKVLTGRRITSLDGLATDLVLADVAPRGLLAVAGDRLPRRYRRALERFQYGPGVFKVDWALSGPIPWVAPACREAGTVHVGGSLEEIEGSEQAIDDGPVPRAKPFVLLTQPTVADATRAPAGRHTAWAYCHVPNGSRVDMTTAIEDQVERFAPGFRTRIEATSTRGPADIERDNSNMVGGDVGGGANSLRQLLIRPTWRQYTTPISGLFLCSASTPPGGGVHGMCGYHASRRALASLRR